MANYTPPIDDIKFLMERVFDFDGIMSSLSGFEDFNTEMSVSVLEEAGKFCTEIVEPLNRPGDEEGCTLENGVVTTPKGMPDAYRQFAQAGWSSLSGDPKFGGQGLPRALQLLLDEMLAAVNVSFGLFPGLTRGAVEAIEQHASYNLKAIYLAKLISGEWTGVMALTEAIAGTDLGLLSTRATPNPDGSYNIRGTKIFISSGDHDFGGNIIHLVLARLPDAPKGVKGISLLLCPKFLVEADGSLGARNAVTVGALEEKMGIHAQPTCVMNYDDAVGWLVGEAGHGLNAMFTMMNAERLFIGVQGLGVAESATQKAVAYAKERLQGNPPEGGRGPVSIIQHPDVRKMLLAGRAFTDAARALAMWTALQMDIASRHPDAATRKSADGLVALLTPVIKASFTDFAFETTVLSQQVFGGHGYIREWGMEQLVRDARIAQIYEGTNGVQAMDLVGRKLLMEEGHLPNRFFALVASDLRDVRGLPDMQRLAAPLAEALARLEQATSRLSGAGGIERGSAATDYLRLFALVAFGWMWLRMAAAATASGAAVSPLEQRKVKVAHFFMERILPQSVALDAMLANGASSLMALEADAF